MASVFRDDLFAAKRVLITGGGTGMGRVFAEAFARHGADVLIASRSEEHLKPTAAAIQASTGRRVLWRVADVRKPEDLEALVAYAKTELGGIDVLINNAAGNFFVQTEAMSPNAWKTVVDIVLNGTFLMSRAAFPLLKASKGCVVNVVASYAWGAAPYVAHSGAAKAGVLNLTRSLALEWARHGIRVNAVTPGVVPTEGAKGQLFPTPEIEKTVVRSIPLGRLGTSEEVADAILFLASPAAKYVTGDNLVVDAGQWLAGNAFFSIGSAMVTAGLPTSTANAAVRNG